MEKRKNLKSWQTKLRSLNRGFDIYADKRRLQKIMDKDTKLSFENGHKNGKNKKAEVNSLNQKSKLL